MLGFFQTFSQPLNFGYYIVFLTDLKVNMMFKFMNRFYDVSELSWDVKKSVDNVKQNKEIRNYIINCHIVILVCTLIYGGVLGAFVSGAQIVLNAVKVPLLFFVTLYIAVPIIFMIDVLYGNKIKFSQMTLILLFGFTCSAVILIAFAPLMLFYILTTTDYSFIVALNFFICGFAGYFGIITMFSSGNRFHKHDTWNIGLIVGGFIIIFVGTQLAWVLRPFFHSYAGFTKPISGNFYMALAQTMQQNPVLTSALFVILILITVFISIVRIVLESDKKPKNIRYVYVTNQPRQKVRPVKKGSSVTKQNINFPNTV